MIIGPRGAVDAVKKSTHRGARRRRQGGRGSSPGWRSSCRSNRSKNGDRASRRRTRVGSRTPTALHDAGRILQSQPRRNHRHSIGRTTESRAGGPIWGSPRTSSRGGSGASSHHRAADSAPEIHVDDRGNGEKNEIPLSLHVNYEIAPYKGCAMGNTPPVLKFEPTGKRSPVPDRRSGNVTAIVHQPTPITSG